MCKACDYTIHGRQSHFGWDNSLVPAERVAPGSTILFQCHDSSAGQLGPSSTLQDVVNLDCGKINPVSGPIFVEGAEPGDALKVTLDSFAPQLREGTAWGWTANIPGFGLLADQFLEHFDGFSIGSNDLTQLTLALDRDSGLVADLFDEQNEAVLALMSQSIAAAKRAGKYIGICGQGPSDHPALAQWLMEQGIDSVSLNPDSVLSTWLALAGEPEAARA